MRKPTIRTSRAAAQVKRDLADPYSPLRRGLAKLCSNDPAWYIDAMANAMEDAFPPGGEHEASRMTAAADILGAVSQLYRRDEDMLCIANVTDALIRRDNPEKWNTLPHPAPNVAWFTEGCRKPQPNQKPADHEKIDEIGRAHV